MTPQTAALHGTITALTAAGTGRDPAETATMILDTIALAISRQLDAAITANEHLLQERAAAGLTDEAHEIAVALRVHRNNRIVLRAFLGLDQTAPTTPPPPAAVPPAVTAPPTPTTDIRHHRQPSAFAWWRRRGDPTT